MAFQFIDGFDVYPDINTTPQGLQACWLFQNNFALQAFALVEGRFGGQCVQITNVTSFVSGSFGQPVATGRTFAVGFAFMLETPNPPTVLPIIGLEIANGGTIICDVAINPNQQLCIRVGGAVVATAAPVLPEGGWHYIEVEFTIAAVGGVINLFMDGFQTATFAGNTGNADCTFIAFAPGSTASLPFVCKYDDVYCKNTAAREGERRVETLVPTGDSAVQWTPLSGTSNFAMVDELPVNGDTDYVFTSTVGNQDLYNMSDLAGTPTAISAVQVRVCSRKDDSATRTMATVLSSGATVTPGPTYPVSASYQYQRDIYATDPNTSAAWTANAVNAALVGQKVIS